jgi:hypothetical protein
MPPERVVVPASTGGNSRGQTGALPSQSNVADCENGFAKTTSANMQFACRIQGGRVVDSDSSYSWYRPPVKSKQKEG